MNVLTKLTATLVQTASLCNNRRCLSSISKELIAESEKKAERHRNFMKPSMIPRGSVFQGDGKDLHIPKNMTEVAVFNGMPAEHAARTVIIAPKILKTLQSGDRSSNFWELSWKHRERWTNPLMGWTSSADPMAQVRLSFDSSDDAVAFAKKNGWKFEVLGQVTPQTIAPGTYNYSHNFLPAKTIEILKKSGGKAPVFKAPGYGKSHWFMPITFHGDAEVDQHGNGSNRSKVVSANTGSKK